MELPVDNGIAFYWNHLFMNIDMQGSQRMHVIQMRTLRAGYEESKYHWGSILGKCKRIELVTFGPVKKSGGVPVLPEFHFVFFREASDKINIWIYI